jgi:putative restriction endonuclease
MQQLPRGGLSRFAVANQQLLGFNSPAGAALMVNLFVANTDNAWFDFLSAESNVTEVNFWSPGETALRAIVPGELLVFRLKSPRNKIGGFGLFSNYSPLPIQIAWDSFGRANGAASFGALRDSIARYRGPTVGPMTNIGCTIIVEPVFFPCDLWIDVPQSWSRGIQRGKLYSTEEVEGLKLWTQLQDTAQICAAPLASELAEVQARYGAPTLITPRLGQGAFRIAVTEAYNRQCAVTDGKVLPALDAAHMRPFSEGGFHIKSNGILLRKDIHSVFDAGYVTVDAGYHFQVSRKVRGVFNNGEEYLRLNGKPLRLPTNKTDWPNPDFLRWHNENRFLS